MQDKNEKQKLKGSPKIFKYKEKHPLNRLDKPLSGCLCCGGEGGI